MRTIQKMLDESECDNLVDFLFKCKIDFKFFCENVLADTPFFLRSHGGIHDFQLEWFYLIQNNKRVMIQAPSGFSKSTIVGMAYPLWLAFNYQNKQILVVSKTLPQSTRILGLIKQAIEENELLQELRPKNHSETWSKQEIKTSTNCRIYCRPYSINIKGERVDFMLLDEIASYERLDIFFDYIVPRLNPKGTLAGISTPESPTDLMETIKVRGGKEYIFKRYTAIKNGKAIWPERFSLDWLKAREKEMGEEYFQKNFMCNPQAEAENAIFSKKAIVDCFDPQREFSTEIEGRSFLGCDFAISKGPTGDFDAYVAIDKIDGNYIIKTMEMYKGLLTPGKVRRIRQLKEIYNPVRIAVDKSNLGATVVDELRLEALPISPYDFHPQTRRELLNTLRNIIDSGKLIIPRSGDDTKAIKMTNLLFKQLMGFREKENKLTGTRSYASTAPHDDLVMALALAVAEAVKQRSSSIFIASSR